MRRILALTALAWWALSAPAFAALTQIAGSGQGGAVGFAYGAAGTTQPATLNTTVPVGSLLVVSATIRATGSGQSVSSCADSQGNTYTASGANVVNNTVSSRQFWSILTTALTTSDTVTCTYSNSVARKAVTLLALSGSDASPVDASSTSANGNSTTIAAGPTGTLSCPGTGNCEVIVAATGYDGGTDIFTAEGSGFTTLHNGGADTHTAFQIVTSNSAITYSPAVTAVSRSWAVTLMGYKSDGIGGVTAHSLSLLGAGR